MRAFFILIGAALLVFLSWLKFSPGPMTEAEPSRPAEALETWGEIHFSRQLVIHNDLLAVDDEEPRKVPCGTDPHVFGRVKVAEGVFGDLSCADNDSGGISLKVGGHQHKLGMFGTDGGELSDTRSWVTLTPEGWRVARITLWSRQEMNDSAPVQCGSEKEVLRWNAKSGDLTAMPDEAAGPVDWNPPPAIHESCTQRD